MPDPISSSSSRDWYDPTDDRDDIAPDPKLARNTASTTANSADLRAGDARLDDVLSGRAVYTEPTKLAPEAFEFLKARDPKNPREMDRLYGELAALGSPTPCKPTDTVGSLMTKLTVAQMKRDAKRDAEEDARVRIDDSGRQGTSNDLRAGEIRDRIELANPGSGAGAFFAGLAAMRGGSRDEIAAAGQMGNIIEGIAGGAARVIEDAKEEREVQGAKGTPDRAVATRKAIDPVNGKRPMNYRLASESLPAAKLPQTLRTTIPQGVRFKYNGFPDFAPHAIRTTRLSDLDGSELDMARASEAVGLPRHPRPLAGYTWHHHEDGETMQLIPRELHESVRHTGGRAILKQRESSRE